MAEHDPDAAYPIHPVPILLIVVSVAGTKKWVSSSNLAPLKFEQNSSKIGNQNFNES